METKHFCLLNSFMKLKPLRSKQARNLTQGSLCQIKDKGPTNHHRTKFFFIHHESQLFLVSTIYGLVPKYVACPNGLVIIFWRIKE